MIVSSLVRAVSRRLVLSLAFGALALLAPAFAQAHDHDGGRPWHERDWHERDWREREWRGWDRPPVAWSRPDYPHYVGRRWLGPGYYLTSSGYVFLAAPPPAFFAPPYPPPPYPAAGGVTLVLPFRF